MSWLPGLDLKWLREIGSFLKKAEMDTEPGKINLVLLVLCAILVLAGKLEGSYVLFGGVLSMFICGVSRTPLFEMKK